ncbi:hypothetical protein LCGC14_1792740 [marine sediment metagenome]|uniref:Uncharacterized protein n=1 Tax=marine sediment metagenome TaxID=412755 RepID=A0A0F9J6U7_9ZZZZ
MIVKVKNSEEGWSYFECNIIHSRYNSFSDLLIQKDAIILFDAEPVKGNKEGKQVKYLNLETEKSHLRTIITDRVCYVLNDQGKTIDKI